jgi:phosphoadenosine phosphosulfate reductase
VEDDKAMIDTSVLDRHGKISLSFSGGKDSLACVYLLMPHLDRITIYHLDTGDLLPEMQEAVRDVERFAPHFIRVNVDARAWIAENGTPSDLVPYSSHAVGMAAGQGSKKLVSRYQCCYANLMAPLWKRIIEDGNTLCIRGTKIADQAKLPAASGSVHDGVELWFPLENWSHERVFEFLMYVGAPHNRIYDHMTNSPECARCPAWWSEGRSAYLKKYHPDMFREYISSLRSIAAEIAPSVDYLRRELAEVE